MISTQTRTILTTHIVIRHDGAETIEVAEIDLASITSFGVSWGFSVTSFDVSCGCSKKKYVPVPFARTYDGKGILVKTYVFKDISVIDELKIFFFFFLSTHAPNVLTLVGPVDPIGFDRTYSHEIYTVNS